MNEISCPAPCWRITLDTNPDLCNLHCMMCEDHSDLAKSRKSGQPKRPLMSLELMESILAQAARFGVREIIPSTMGEPLLYPHFLRMLELCRQYDMSLNLTTNGTFPPGPHHYSVEDWAHRIVPLATDVKISWNGATETTQQRIMPGTSLSGHLMNAQKFIAVRDKIHQETGHYCRMTMQMTFMEANLDEIPAMIQLACELGFDRIKGHQLWVHFPEMENCSLRRSSESIRAWNEIARQCRTIASENRVPAGKTPIQLVHFFDLDPNHKDEISPNGICPFLGKEAWVDSSGHFNVCCAPDTLRKSLGDFGDLVRQSLEEIWNSPAYRNLCKTYMANDLCKVCNMRS